MPRPQQAGDLIEFYHLEVVGTRDGTTLEISASTRHLISAARFKNTTEKTSPQRDGDKFQNLAC
jgi:hypothetical protein